MRRSCGISGFFYLASLACAPLFEDSYYGYFIGYAWLDWLLACLLHFSRSPNPLQLIAMLSAFLCGAVLIEGEYTAHTYLFESYQYVTVAFNLVFIAIIVRPPLGHR